MIYKKIKAVYLVDAEPPQLTLEPHGVLNNGTWGTGLGLIGVFLSRYIFRSQQRAYTHVIHEFYVSQAAHVVNSI